TLEQQALSPVPLGYIALLRVLSHWMVTGLPLVILTPVIAVPLGIPGQSLPAILLLLLPGTLAFSLLGAIGAALTVSLRSHGLLLPVLVLPLAVPVLIFGARGTLLAMGGDWPTGPLYMLAFLAALGASLGPLAMAGVLRISLDWRSGEKKASRAGQRSSSFSLLPSSFYLLGRSASLVSAQNDGCNETDMWKWFHQLASPPHYYRMAGAIIPWTGWPALLLIIIGAVGGLYLAPPDYQQGDAFRIIYVHVPSAWLSMFGYVVMATAAAIGLIWRMKLAHVAANA